MRIALLSDPHANLAALETALQRIDRQRPDEIWCLGDIVGYGPDPAAVTRLVRERCHLVLAGNHDLMLAGRAQPGKRPLGGPLGECIELAHRQMSDTDKQWLFSLKPVAARHGIAAVHASPRDPVWEFISSYTTAKSVLELMEQVSPVLVFGHTHVPEAFLLRPNGKIDRRSRTPGKLLHLQDAQRCLLNPGAIGRPQADNNPVGSYMILDTEQWTVVWHEVHYPVEKTQARIAQEGLDPWLARTLGGARR